MAVSLFLLIAALTREHGDEVAGSDELEGRLKIKQGVFVGRKQSRPTGISIAIITGTLPPAYSLPRFNDSVNFFLHNNSNVEVSCSLLSTALTGYASSGW